MNTSRRHLLLALAATPAALLAAKRLGRNRVIFDGQPV